MNEQLLKTSGADVLSSRKTQKTQKNLTVKERCLSLHTETETRNDSARHPRGNDLREGHGGFGKDAHLWNIPSYAPKNNDKSRTGRYHFQYT